jgi:tetratricopeptide (TPR) repeat protein
MPAPTRFPLLVLAALLAQSACATSALHRGAELYVEGRYIDADQVFEQTEPQLADYAAEERAHYGLYRGATLAALGDHQRARRWLAYGVRFDRAGYSSGERALLERSLRDVSSVSGPSDDTPGVGSSGLAASPAPPVTPVSP